MLVFPLRFQQKRTLHHYRLSIAKDELKAFQEIAKDLLDFDDMQLAAAIKAGEIMEV